MHREVEVAIILFVNQVRARLQFLNMNQLKRYMLEPIKKIYVEMVRDIVEEDMLYEDN